MRSRFALLSAVLLVPALLTTTSGQAGAATGSATNPQAPFLANQGLTTMAWAAPVLAADGTGVLAAYVAPLADGRHLYVRRWTPGSGWGTPTALFVGSIEPSGVHISTRNGRAAVSWTDIVGRSVRRMHVAVRADFGKVWGPAHQIFRGNLSTFGTVVVGFAGVTALWSSRATAPVGDAPMTTMTAQWWDPATRAWTSPHVLSDNGSSRFGLAAVGHRFVASWQSGSGNLRYATLSAGAWSEPLDLTEPGQPCGYATSAAAADRYIVVSRCGSGTNPAFTAHDWIGWDEASPAPESTPLAIPAGAHPQVIDIDTGFAALLTTTAGSGGTVSILRSGQPGVWSRPVTVTSTAYTGATVSVAYPHTIVTWVQLSTTSPKLTRIMSRSATSLTGAFTSAPVALTPWGSTFFNVQAGNWYGAAAAWQRTVAGVTYVQAATWTARAGWSKTRTLTRQLALSSHPTIALTITDAAMVGWVSPTRNGATAASLADPRPVGRPTVTRSGRTLTCTAPRFSPAPATISYRWLADGTAVYGATGRTLRVGTALLGRQLACRVRGSTPGFLTRSAYSVPVVVR